jgi:hypothetical protein
MIKSDLFDNTKEAFIVFETSKQQPAFYPKEESQMFQSKDFDYVTGDANNSSVNQDSEAFSQRATGSYLPLNSSHTATDYIGATNVKVSYTISDTFSDFKLYDLTKAELKDLYSNTDTAAKLKKVVNGLNSIRIPVNIFNTILSPSDEAAIIANGNDPIVKNYGLYYVIIKPKYVQSVISRIEPRAQYDWTDIPANNDGSGNPIQKRRTVYFCDIDDFKSTVWNFEGNGKQSSRLFGSVIEVWDSSGENLKQVKVVMENQGDFSSDAEMGFVMSPDNVGYDPASQNPSIGDVIRVYPRETYFDDIVIEVNYKDKYLQVENMIAFMLNDVARDVLTGGYSIYDDKGFTVDTNGTLTGNVIHRYQISATDRYELRKRIKQ